MPLAVNQIKFINSLKLKKNRISQRLFVAEGEKTIRELIHSSLSIKGIYTTHPETFSDYKGTIETITEKELARISRLSAPNKALAVVEMPSFTFDANIAFNELVLVAEGINDPGNLGTLLRIADWFGFRHIVCSPDSVDVYNPKTIQSSMGSIARTQVHYLDLPTLFNSFDSGNKPDIYGAFLDGENIRHVEKSPTGFIVFGSESHGISAALEPLIEKRLTIPKFGQAESLNIAIAAAIFCAEFRLDSSK